MIQRPIVRGMGRFSLIWLGQTVSIVGSRTSAFAIGVSLLLATGSVTRYSLIALSIAVPLILLSPIAGVMADRFDRRLILLFSTLGTALGSIGLLTVVRSGGLEGWHVYALLALKAACNAFALPTFTAATTLIVGKRHLARASGMNNMGLSLGQVLGPLLGGILLTPLGLETILLIDIATFLVPIAILLLVRFPQPTGARPGEAQPGTAQPSDAAGPARERPEKKRLDPKLGWRYLRQRPALLRLLLLTAGLQFSLGFAQVLFAPLVLSFANPAVLGIVLSVSATGMLVGGLFVSLWGGPVPARRVAVILIAMLAEGLLLMLAGLQPSALLIASAAFFFMFAIPMVSGANQATWQSKVPPALQGRAFAVRSIVQGGAAPLAIAAAGPLSDYVFEPLMAVGGPLADSVGRVVGVGPGRGIGLLLVVVGLGLAAMVAVASRSRRLRLLEQEVADAEGLDVGRTPESAGPAGLLDSEPATGPGDEAEKFGQGALPHLAPVPALALGLMMVLAAAWALLSQRPPAAVDASAPTTEFSAERALRHVEVIAAAPRPTGSAAHRQVADYLVAQLEELGLETHVQRTVRVFPTPRLTRVATVANVVARLSGREPHSEGRSAVMLAAHYDSVAGSPGASDNGAAVATLLETARALVAGAPPRHDIILLFVDAEEIGLLGARAFVRDHPWAKEVAVVINFDARGHGGPVYMFETGDANGWWIPRLAAGAPLPVANSLMTQIYQLLPNATDFTVFRNAGYAGFNLASIEGLTHYHTMLDRPSDLDPRTVQHQGSYALGLARHLSSADLEPDAFAEDGADRVYFNLPGIFVHYPPALAAVSVALATAAFLALLRFGLRRRLLSPLGIFQGFLAHFAIMAVLVLAVTLLWALVRTLAGVPVVMGSTGGAFRYMIAFAALTVAGFAVLYRFFRRIAGPLNLAIGALTWWLILAIATSGPWLPLSANFLFAWPLLFGAAGLATLLKTRTRSGWPMAAVLALAALPAILLLAPFIGLLYVGLQSLFELGGAALAPLVLLLGLLIPQIEAISARWPRRLPALAAGVGAVMLVVAVAERDGPVSQNSVLYAMDADTGEHHWFTLDRRFDPWIRHFGFEPGVLGPFRHFFPLVRGDLQRAGAPSVELPEPELKLLDHRENGRVGEYRLRLRAAAGSQVRAIWFEPAEAVISAELAGRDISLAGGNGRIPLIQQIPPAWPEQEMTLRVRQGTSPVTVHLTEQLEGLPQVPGIEPRPADMIARPLFTTVRSDVTLIKRSLLLPTEPATSSSSHDP